MKAGEEVSDGTFCCVGGFGLVCSLHKELCTCVKLLIAGELMLVWV